MSSQIYLHSILGNTTNQQVFVMGITELLNINLPSPVQPLPESLSTAPTDLLAASNLSLLSKSSESSQLKLFVKRDDLIHDIISGNKWRKLQGVFKHWTTDPINLIKGSNHIVSFGGGYSNHLHALGYACHQLNIPFTAMIRGDYSSNLSPMLQDLIGWRADIRWLTRLDYRKKNDIQWLATQIHDFQGCLVIPEGGSSNMVHSGMQQLVEELPEDLDYLLCPIGSGGTLAGVIQAIQKLKRKTQVIGIAVLKGEGYLENLVKDLINSQEVLKEKSERTNQNWQIMHNYHFGGYAKSKPELNQFMQNFHDRTNIAVEPVYSGKLMFALYDLISQGYFPMGSKVCAIHTGGLQGQRQIK